MTEVFLSATVMVATLDPGDDRNTQFLTTRPSLGVEHTQVAVEEKRLHRSGVTGRHDSFHGSDQAVIFW
ncbi:hypothetical protein GSS88_00460 [Corynebacterium sp. 3HC-13]|uniref:hypothetical protein n=1 Tax=Corynebacterium poyangense TaxID=2684405 RepID=UPI001CC9C249|nr:hypothetical protein [Corynebacterium poyangense]MBZ8176280.1 hypothetical protein [Corynebacterium poyangense]